MQQAFMLVMLHKPNWVQASGTNLLKVCILKAEQRFFDRYYAEFSPEACTDANGNAVDSWKMPSYTLFDLHTGYRFKLKAMDKLNFTIKLNVLNLLDKMYISDAINNDTYLQNAYNTFDARSASVFMGAGRQVSASLKIVFN